MCVCVCVRVCTCVCGWDESTPLRACIDTHIFCQYFCVLFLGYFLLHHYLLLIFKQNAEHGFIVVT